MRRKQAKARLIAVQDNKKEGEAFLAENKTKEGVKALPGGLQYKILKAGEGRSRPKQTRWSANIGAPSSMGPSSTAPIAPGNPQPSSSLTPTSSPV